ncbi:hypothetical protein VCHC48B2_3495, partial [Vibrio cholerae HC-48B2]
KQSNKGKGQRLLTLSFFTHFHLKLTGCSVAGIATE